MVEEDPKNLKKDVKKKGAKKKRKEDGFGGDDPGW